MRDEELLEVYMIGYQDELYGRENMKFYLGDHKLKSRAYYMGRAHYCIPEKQTSLDYASEEEIIKWIRTEKIGA
jgi:hypothetical protein|nr:MAG TPA: hypothetical protein [Caudoviricetes sp.]